MVEDGGMKKGCSEKIEKLLWWWGGECGGREVSVVVGR